MCQNSSFRDPFESNKNPWRSNYPPELTSNPTAVKVYHGFHEASPGKNSSLSFKSSERSPSRDLAFFVFLVFVFPPQLAQLRFCVFNNLPHGTARCEPWKIQKKRRGVFVWWQTNFKRKCANVFCWTENPGSSCLCLNTFRLAGSNFRLPTDSID